MTTNPIVPQKPEDYNIHDEVDELLAIILDEVPVPSKIIWLCYSCLRRAVSRTGTCPYCGTKYAGGK